MYLKEIKAYGFKSFADKINIELNKNLNAIVGPNGSGKSNIVDAVRWVLGEQSNKSLRAESNSDVIFSGSKSRKPLNSASVTLVFDNQDHHFPVDYSEVAIKRVAYRTGENEYYLNNTQCRLKDINNLLLDTGIAKESFNIISQGKIDEILSSKPTDRRVIFEEASGVLKYKKRKEEALRKLDRTNDNLKRVSDIILEIESNLLPLQEQSEKASEYLDIKDKLKDIEIALITHDIEQDNYEYQELENNISLLEDELTSLNNNNISYDIDIIKEKNNLKDVNDNMAINQNKLLELVSKIERLDGEIRLLKEREKYHNSNDDNSSKILKLQEDNLKLANELQKITHDEELNNQKILNIHELIEKNNLLYLDKKRDKDRIFQERENLRQNIFDYQHKISYLQEVITNNNSLPSSVKNILNNQKFTGIHNVVGKLIDVDDKYSLAIATALGSSSNYLVVDTPEVAKRAINYLKENNLGRATFYPLSTIKEKKVDQNTLNVLSDTREFLGMADTLVNYEDKYHNIIANLLGNTIITSDLDNANHLGKLINNRYRLITLDGQVVNVGGSLTGGSNYKVNSILKEKNDLVNYQQLLISSKQKEEKLQIDFSKIIEDINNLENKNNELVLEKQHIQNIIDNILKEKEELLYRKNNSEEELKSLKNISDNDSSSYESELLEKLYALKREKEDIDKNISSLTLEKNKLEQSIEEIENNNKQANFYLSKKEKELANLKIKYNRLEVKIDNLLLNLTEEYNLTFDNAKANYHLDLEEDLARDLVHDYKNKLDLIGIVNLGSIEEYQRVKERYDFLTSQKNDLLAAEDTLNQIIHEMDDIMQDKFLNTFNQIKSEFALVFQDLFKGGYAEISLTEPDNLLETGIEIKAEPPGKKLQSISLLSGGEKTFTAISLLFAILNVRPVPFCLLDEVEAALDEANVDSFGKYLEKYNNKTQIILITHKKKTMEYVDVLYGLTMQESGVSKLVSVKLEK